MRLILCIFVCFLVNSCVSKTDSSADIIRNLEAKAKPYFDGLVSTEGYQEVLQRIEAGDEVLISGAPQLAQWTDASTALSLRYSLSRAIIKNPDDVMGLVPDSFSVSELCTIPYIEESIAVESNHVDQSILALQNSSKPSEAHQECIEIYKSLSRNIEKRQ